MKKYTAVYLSPHLDDAVFSCGGSISSSVMQGENILVATMCTKKPEYISAYAEAHHHDSALSNEEAVSLRLAEDENAMRKLGVEWLWLDFEDAIYRNPNVYNSDSALFGDISYEDKMIDEIAQSIIRILDRCSNATVYSPLGVGHHVDHQLAFSASILLEQYGYNVVYYEDVPYVLRPGALEHRLNILSNRFHATKMVPNTIEIGSSIEHKIDACRCYASQLGDLNAIRTYAFSLSHDNSAVERIWKRVGY